MCLNRDTSYRFECQNGTVSTGVETEIRALKVEVVLERKGTIFTPERCENCKRENAMRIFTRVIYRYYLYQNSSARELRVHLIREKVYKYYQIESLFIMYSNYIADSF